MKNVYYINIMELSYSQHVWLRPLMFKPTNESAPARGNIATTLQRQKAAVSSFNKWWMQLRQRH